MMCVSPWYRNSEVKFSPYMKITPCGKCIACKKAKSIEWSIRLRHELHYHKRSCYLTLTYDDDNVQMISKRELQLFFKRLREKFKDRKIKYFACGEYGGQTLRPHYHAIVFGIGGIDELRIRRISGKYNSQIIDEIWNRGFNVAGAVEPKSINYVCGYIRKKIGIKLPDGFTQPFQLQSQGFGLRYAQEFEDEIRDKGIILKGKNLSIPRYYIKKLELEEDDYKRSELESPIKKIINRYEFQDYDFLQRKINLEKKESLYESKKI